ncbi:hypothetical protein H2248_001949 [Termitomyces sp. 'cryptogamus']|nr:hypothetical protein H2248_001949 [Termitomyces sp. 'cryptogamus']
MPPLLTPSRIHVLIMISALGVSSHNYDMKSTKITIEDRHEATLKLPLGEVLDLTVMDNGGPRQVASIHLLRYNILRL